MRESVFIGTLGILFGAACGGSEAKADVTADVAATEVPDLSEDTAVEVSPEVEADTEVETGVDASGPEGWDRASAWLSVTVAGYANNAPRTVLAGALWATPEPETYALQEDTGSCRLSFGENFFCDPPCDAGVCTAPDPDDQCTPYPALLSAGNVVISGAGESVSMKPGSDGSGGYASESDGALWATGSELTFSATGADVPAFTASLRMIEPMVGKNLAALDLKRPLVIEWDPPTSSGNPTRVNILLQSDRGQHGRAYAAVLECDVPDSGRFEIPPALQAKYIDDALWGCGKCPPSKLSRNVRTRVQAGAQGIDVRVETQETFLLTPWSTPAL